MPVNTPHVQYAEYLPEWTMIDAFMGGERVVKKDKTYLANPFAKSDDADGTRYELYRKLASFMDITSNTVDALHGMAFAKDVGIELPPELEYLIDNCDGEGNGLSDGIKRTGHNVIKLGRDGLLTDYPEVDRVLTKAQKKSLNINAKILRYSAKNILNWRLKGGVLIEVRLQEEYEEATGEFDYEIKEQIRVLSLKDGIYTSSIYRDDVFISSYNPKDITGATLKRIPFFFVGSVNNDAQVDRPPVSKIAYLNQHQYQNRADAELNAFQSSGATLVVALGENMSQKQFEDANEDGVNIGVFGVLSVGAGGDAKFVQAQESNASRLLALDKLEDAKMLGARLVMPKSGNTTVNEVDYQRSGETSPLATMMRNVSKAYKEALDVVCLFEGADANKVTVNIDDEFYTAKASADILNVFLGCLDRGITTKIEGRKMLATVGIIDEMSDQDHQNALDTSGEEVMD